MRITKGKLRRIIREAILREQSSDMFKWQTAFEDEPSEPSKLAAKQGKDYYSDTIVMSPTGDSVLVNGEETYPQDVPNKLEVDTGFKMDPASAKGLVDELQKQFDSGYVELPVQFKQGKWSF